MIYEIASLTLAMTERVGHCEELPPHCAESLCLPSRGFYYHEIASLTLAMTEKELSLRGAQPRSNLRSSLSR